MVNTNFIPKRLLETWVQKTQSKLAILLQTPNISLGHLEMALEECGRELLLPVLAAVANAAAALQPFQCPLCHKPLLAQDQNRQRTLNTVSAPWS